MNRALRIRERGQQRDVSELRELFWGRFTEEDIEILYFLNDFVKHTTVRHIFTSDPRKIRRVIEDGRLQWENVKRKRQAVPKCGLPNIRQGTIDTTCRLFACKPCDSSWWRNVPFRKQVSKCKKCSTRYDPVPRNKEWGWAEFECDGCGNTFSGFCEMGVGSPCYKCNKSVFPTSIQPPKRRPERNWTSKQTHSCGGCQQNIKGGTTNVYAQGTYIAGGAKFQCVHLCAHPSTRRQNNLPAVLTPSQVHGSTGSTVATFLPQDDLGMTKHEVYDRISHLGSIDEASEPPPNVSSDEDDSGSNGRGGTD